MPAVWTEVGIAVCFMPTNWAVDGAGLANGGIQFQRVVWDIGIITHDVQLTQALWAYDFIFVVDERLGAQVHFLATFGTDVVHNRVD